MKIYIMTLAVVALAVPLMAQEISRDDETPKPTPAVDKKDAENKRPESTPDQGRGFNQRNVRLVDGTLEKLGINEEQFRKVAKLQISYVQKMNENSKRLNIARGNFSKLLEEESTEEELEKAICEIADAQAEQLRIIVRNRRAIEKILGKEKYNLFMEEAAKLFQQHNQRPGMGIPPRPDMSAPSSNEQRGRDGWPDVPAPSSNEQRGRDGWPDVPAPSSNEQRGRDGWPNMPTPSSNEQRGRDGRPLVS